MALKNFIIEGKANFAKIVGDPVPGYDEDQLEWTLDLIPNDEEKQKYLETGGSPQYIKEHKKTGEDYIRFTRKAVKKDGTPGKPITIVDAQGKPWDDRKIGNGSTLRVSYTLNEVGRGKDLRLKPAVLAVQIWDFIPYAGKSVFDTKPVTEAEGTTKEW